MLQGKPYALKDHVNHEFEAARFNSSDVVEGRSLEITGDGNPR